MYNRLMVTIRSARQEDIPAIKFVIYSVAYNIFGFDGTLEDSILYYEKLESFQDLANIQTHYFENGGLFLVALKSEQVIGSGALRKLDKETAELKRMWLLEAYHGQGIGYRLITQLFEFARSQGYIRIRLQTSPEQTRALNFYRKIGFFEIPCYNDASEEISLEFIL